MNSTARALAPLSLLAALTAAQPAAADEPKSIEVTVNPRGQTWSVGDFSRGECSPTCLLHLPPAKYVVSIGGAKEEMLLDGPTDITYSPGSPKLHTAAGWIAIGGIGSGAALLGLGIWGYAKSCTTSCAKLPPISRTAAQVLVTTAGIMISVSVTGAILFAVTGESITAKDVKRPAAASRMFDVVVSPSTLGGAVSLVGRF